VPFLCLNSLPYLIYNHQKPAALVCPFSPGLGSLIVGKITYTYLQRSGIIEATT